MYKFFYYFVLHISYTNVFPNGQWQLKRETNRLPTVYSLSLRLISPMNPTPTTNTWHREDKTLPFMHHGRVAQYVHFIQNLPTANGTNCHHTDNTQSQISQTTGEKKFEGNYLTHRVQQMINYFDSESVNFYILTHFACKRFRYVLE